MEQTEQKEREARRKPSLKWELFSIVLACWILPMLIVVAMMGYFIQNNINTQIETIVSGSAEDAIKTCVSRVDAAVDSSRNASYYTTISNAYGEYLRTGDRVTLYGKMYSFLAKQYQYDEDFLTEVLYFTDEPDFLYTAYNRKYSYDGLKKYQAVVHEKVQEVAPGLDTGVYFLEVDGSFYLVRNILNEHFRPYAVLTMELNIPSLFGSLENIPRETASAVWIGGTAIPVVGEPLPNPASLGLDFALGEQGMDERGTITYVYGMEQTFGGPLTYVVSIDRVLLRGEIREFQLAFLGILLLILPLLGLAVRFFYLHISRPVDVLIGATRYVERGELGYQITEPSHNREFLYLMQSFNAMSGRLKQQFEQLYSEELALRDAHIMALQSQINPHFLNNTLEIINWEARLADNVKVSHMIEALSTMLDAAMDRHGKPVVRLSEEMMYVDAYLYIISERLGKRLTVHKKIDEALLSCMVPRLVLQPILENAVEHGVQRRQQGVIIIRVYRRKDALVLEIENDGGMTEDDEHRVAQLLSPEYDAKGEGSTNLGIRNVNQRVRILYGAGSGLTIMRTKEGHSVSRIVLHGSGEGGLPDEGRPPDEGRLPDEGPIQN